MSAADSSDANLFKRTSKRSFIEVCSEVESVCREFDFGLIGTIDLKAKMNAKGVPFEHNCTVFEVCNPKIAAGVLSVNMDVASALPCRLAIYTENGQTVVSTLRPTLLFELYEMPKAVDQAEKVEATMAAIVRRLVA